MSLGVRVCVPSVSEGDEGFAAWKFYLLCTRRREALKSSYSRKKVNVGQNQVFCPWKEEIERGKKIELEMRKRDQYIRLLRRV